MIKRSFAVLLLALPLWANDNRRGPPGPPGIQGPSGPTGKAGEDGSHSIEMPLGIGVRWFDGPSWQGVTSYQYEPLHAQNVLSGLIIYKMGPDTQMSEIRALRARLAALESDAKNVRDKTVAGEISRRAVIRGSK